MEEVLERQVWTFTPDLWVSGWNPGFHVHLTSTLPAATSHDPASTSQAKKPKPGSIGPRGLGSDGPRLGTTRRSDDRFLSPSNPQARIRANSWPRHG